ncbi:hypothetical protein [Chryseobacterium populi]|uniref:Uncharacterized protein n=1 Tax=Chryseobacterium populi TaxID=1144316 RepID=J3CL63_9FLAO|nr:hypothetical protein [Chryseobacterium populi]EJL73776.1 hypothetical protein PMI13_01349 [Chryseobacterium populi]
MKKENLSIIAFVAVLMIALIRFYDSSVYTILSADHAGIIQECIKKSFSRGIFFGGSISVGIILGIRTLKKTK